MAISIKREKEENNMATLIDDILQVKKAIDQLCKDGYQFEIIFETPHITCDWEDLQWYVQLALECAEMKNKRRI